MLGPLMIDIAGPDLTDSDCDLLRHPAVGGVILFERNFTDKARLRRLTEQVRALRNPAPIIAVDHEGGRIQRWRDGFSALPSARAIGLLYDSAPREALSLAHALGLVSGCEVAAVGVDVVFAPVLDLDFGISEVIGNRAFHRHPDIVASLAEAVAEGLRDAGVAAVGKHFPGHGGVAPDTHVAAAVDDRDAGVIFTEDLAPYRILLPRGLDGVMTSHVRYPSIDPDMAGFSRFWIGEMLRQRFQFGGLVFSDDMTMAGTGDLPLAERISMALQAGSDMVLICNDRPAVEQLLEVAEIPDARIRAVRRHRWLSPIRAGRHVSQDEIEYRQARDCVRASGLS